MVICRCDLGPASSGEQGPAVTLCSVCGKRVSEKNSTASLTQWIFRDNVCTCKNSPEAQALRELMRQRPSATTQVELGPDELEEAEELPLDSNQFPTDRYKPVKELGRGASGIVYLCRDRLLGKPVAIKCLQSITDAQLVDFQNEARATSQLHHPGVVKIMDFGATAGGSPFMVMEYLTGISLSAFIFENGGLTVEQFTELFSKTAEALAYTHDKSMFHRDIKSSNIILVDDGSKNGVVKLIDFGVAIVKQANLEPTIVQGRTLAGTPLYMPPDQAKGLPYDARSEVYSLGCVMFEALTGRPPFIGDTALETINMHATAPLPPLEDWCSAGNYDECIAQIVQKCLEKDPSKRFRSMQELADELNRNTTKPAGNEQTQVSRRTAYRHLLKPAAIAVSIILLCIIVAQVVVQSGVMHDSSHYVGEATKSLGEGNYDEAIRLSNIVLERDENNVPSLDNRAVAYFLKGSTEMALADLNRAIQVAYAPDRPKELQLPRDGALHFHRAVVYSQLDRVKLAKSDFVRSVEYEPYNWEREKFAAWLKHQKAYMHSIESSIDDVVAVKTTPQWKRWSANNAALLYATDQFVETINEPLPTYLTIDQGPYTVRSLRKILVPPVTILDIRKGVNIHDRDLISVLTDYKKLGTLQMFDCENVNGEFLKVIPRTLITSLAFTKVPILDSNLQYLNKSHINRLYIAGCKTFTGEGFRKFHAPLDELALTWLPVDVDDMYKPTLSSIPQEAFPTQPIDKLQNVGVTNLCIAGDGLTDSDFDDLARLPKVRSLRLIGRRFLPLEYVSRINKMPLLQDVEFYGCKFDWKGLMNRSPKQHQLNLRLAQSGTKDLDLIPLAQLNLEDLSLDEPDLTNGALRHIATMKTLKRVVFVKTPAGTSVEELKKLKESLPLCQSIIYFDSENKNHTL